MTTAATPLRVVLNEGHGSRPLDAVRRYDLIESLLDGGFRVTSTGSEPRNTDSVSDRPAIADNDGADVLILHESDAEGEVTRAEGEELGFRVILRDVSGRDGAGARGIAEEVRDATASYANPGWKPWFPVIDFDRCTNCMQCLSFCLFDVYGVDTAGKIEVRNEEKCKTNCPACSRVCPEVAILFPKYGAGPINGDVVQETDIQREKMKVDISALLGGDIYSMLRDRHARASSRFSKERDEGKALKERLRCLQQLTEDLGVPEEVLMSLPSPDEILSKARQKAAEALDRRED